MAANPWNKSAEAPAEGEPTADERMAELGKALMSPDDPEDAVKAEAVEDEPAEDNPLVDAPEAPDPDLAEVADPEEETSEKLFDDPEEEEPQIPKGWTQGTYKRFSKVIGQRNELRDQITKLEADRDRAKSLAGVLHEKYAEFTDPAAQAARDIQFMDALETLAKQDAGVNEFAAKIVEFIQTGRFNMPDATNPQGSPSIVKTPAAAAEPKHDERVDRIVRRDAQREVSTTLDALGVKPSFQKLIGDAILNDPKLDLTTVDRRLVIERSKAFIKENGFSAEDVLAKQSKPDASSKPATGGGSKPAEKPARRTQERGSSTPAEDSDTNKAPKTLDEWQRRHEERMRSFDS